MAIAGNAGHSRETDVALTEARPRERDTLEVVTRAARPIAGAAADDPALMQLLGGADFALLGEASHGTDDFYRERAAITEDVIERTVNLVPEDWMKDNSPFSTIAETRRAYFDYLTRRLGEPRNFVEEAIRAR